MNPAIKIALGILIIVSSLPAQASFNKAKKIYNRSRNNTAKLAIELHRADLYFSSAIFLREHLNKRRPLNRKLEDLALDLTFKAGLPSFKGLKQRVYRHYSKSPSLSFILGLKRFQNKNYKRAIQALRNIPSSHPLGPESSFIRGSAYSLRKNIKKASYYYQQCGKYSKKKREKNKDEKLNHYFNVVAESCLTHQARLHYQKKDYDKALQTYNQIPKTSYLWPSLLLEKAWASYQKKDYNRALGILVTYKSPLMSSYFFPEADVLRALSYYHLCLWQESLKIIDEYYDVHLKRAQYLKPILLRHKRSPSYFINLMSLSPNQLEKINPFIRSLVTQIRKKTKVALELSTLAKAQKELASIQKLSRSRLVSKLKKQLPQTIKWHKASLNYHIKKQMFAFMNDMTQFSLALSNIKLKIISQKRAYVKKYLSEAPKGSRVQGSLRNVSRSVDQYFYKFHGEFWADELGDYSFGLKSQCKKEI